MKRARIGNKKNVNLANCCRKKGNEHGLGGFDAVGNLDLEESVTRKSRGSGWERMNVLEIVGKEGSLGKCTKVED